MKKTPNDKKATPVTALKHKDKRKNIPTEELRDFIADEEKTPRTVCYPRDPSLDPQLVWKGKDEQDSADLAVPAVPIYIQEKIQPQAIVENVRARARSQPGGKDKPGEQLPLFADFNGIEFQDLIDFYHHEQNWTNRMILGDSLLGMTSLAEKEGLKGRVQMIYMDPPYGIKFGSNWQVSTRKRDVKDGKAEDATRQPEQIKAFRDTWQLGIHSYLAYLRDRLTVARELLTESGSIFVQIGDENVHLVRCVLDEVFGADNFVSQILYRRGGFQTGEHIANTYDYVLWFGKNQANIKVRRLHVSIDPRDWYETGDRWIESLDGSRTIYEPRNLIPEGMRLHSDRSCFSATGGESSRFTISLEGEILGPPFGRGWSTGEVGASRLKNANRLMLKGKRPRFKPYYLDFPLQSVTNGWFDTVRGGFAGDSADDKIYVVQTATTVIQRCLLMTTDPGDLVLDPTCGSGTTAYVAEQWGRRWITLDTSRVAIALARTRLMAAKFPYYLLLDSPEGQKKEAEATGTLSNALSAAPTTGDIRRGFALKRVPHITLKSIANNEEIDAIHERWQETLDPLRDKLNRQLKETWDEWQIPREVNDQWPEKVKELHAEWWMAKRERQKEMDASIAKRAEVELLHDQPYEDNKRIRVTGPFTVESLSPHRVLSTEQERPASETEGQKGDAAGQFETMILDNLRKAGVQNTDKKERLKFERLESHAGLWLHAAGEYLEKGATKRVAICIGPQYGTVGPDLVKDAAKEAVQGLGFDLLIVLGFSFDPHVSEETKRYGKLTVLTARMNPDLAMGQELLKTTGAGNLFMVFGEPDLEVKPQKDGRLVVALKGVDVYDPTTGQVRSSSTDDIACWFIDTDYNGESFFVRHAYFTGADQPYDKLKRALRAEIDESAWSTLYTTKSAPFERPKTGKIAVKVINHYGDEVLKVYAV